MINLTKQRNSVKDKTKKELFPQLFFCTKPGNIKSPAVGLTGSLFFPVST
jgi:hypothetical protein